MRYFALLLLCAGCSPATHRQYDHGRCYHDAFAAQSDLSRATSQDDIYPLSGTEGMALRSLVDEATSDEEKDQRVEGAGLGR